MIDNFLSNFQDGVFHVLNLNAYDHILFLIVLAVPYLFKDWKRVLLLVTVFTLGHCVSLALTAYDVISVNVNLVEFLIPLTILVVALFNVFTAGKKSHNSKVGLLFFATLFFGLVHGLGFVGIFKKMISASENKLIALLEIGLGIEVGQLFIVALFMLALYIYSKFLKGEHLKWNVFVSGAGFGIAATIFIGALQQ